MIKFAKLIFALGNTSSINEKIEALAEFFKNAEETDKIWAIVLLSGKAPAKKIKSSELKKWCCEFTKIPAWLFEESYQHVGDLAETISLLLPNSEKTEYIIGVTLASILEKIYHDDLINEETKKTFILNYWKQLDQQSCFVFNKLLTGGFRIGISKSILIKSIAKVENMPADEVAYRLTGEINPLTDKYHTLLHNNYKSNISKPYPFYLCYPVDFNLDELNNTGNWIAEWKWDGIRGQCIKRNDQYFIWSRGENLITENIPEFEQFLSQLPDGTVIDGEILCAVPKPDKINPLPFSLLQTRINRRTISKKIMQQAPLVFIAYDLLEDRGYDIRNKPLCERKEILIKLVNQIKDIHLYYSPLLSFKTWNELAQIREDSRKNVAEGLMLKEKTSQYLSGRKKGEWWKWKIDPLTIDCVLLYAQKGHGRRSNLYTDYTFAVKDGNKFMTFTKAYSGLTDEEFKEVDHFIKKNGIEKFGPVRTVKPELVFEIAFDGISESKRHKSGIALRFPRMKRLRKDKTPDEINTLDDLRKMLAFYQSHSSTP
jgi:DNA ligase-1